MTRKSSARGRRPREFWISRGHPFLGRQPAAVFFRPGPAHTDSAYRKALGCRRVEVIHVREVRESRPARRSKR